MAKFTNLKDLEAYLQKNLHEMMKFDTKIEDVLKEAMFNAIQHTVYSSHNHVPEEYVRREEDGGLSDRRNMVVTNVEIFGSGIKITFENLTQGADNLKGEYISDFIEFGEGYNGKHWETTGDWSKPRPFSADTANNLRANPDELIHAVKRNLKAMRFTVRN